jgi:N-acetylmuramoyl-L-alanine amidase
MDRTSSESEARTRLAVCALTVLAATAIAGCAKPRAGQIHTRRGDEVMIAGQLFHTGGAKVKLWFDEDGYDAYRIERRFVPWKDAGWEATSAAGALKQPERFGLRFGKSMPAEQIEQVRGGAWPLEVLREKVDQFVLHYDVAGVSCRCFEVLHDQRGLSIHFMLDLDGTIYQTLDVQERAWHATTSNDRSVGIEIANMGAYPHKVDEHGHLVMPTPIAKWYDFDEQGSFVTLPSWLAGGRIVTPGFVARPARPQPIVGRVQGEQLVMMDLTNEQYTALAKLTRTLHEALPKIALDYPRDEHGALITTTLGDEQLADFQGVLGHYHIQSNKIDPGPALDWDRLIREARAVR